MVIRYKWFGLGLCLALTVLAGLLAVERVERLAQATSDLRDQPFALAEALLRAHEHSYTLHTTLRDVIASADGAAAGLALKRSLDHEHLLSEALTVVAQANASEHATLARLFAALADWRAARERVAELLIDGRWADASFVLNTEGERRFRDLHAALAGTLEVERRHAEQLRDEAAAAERSAAMTTVALALLAGGALAAMALGLAAFIHTHRPLVQLRDRLLALAKGDTNVEIPHRQQSNAVGAMARAIERFRQSIIERDAATAALHLSRERLRAAVHEAGRANDSKSRFLAAASHDLRQPLQALRLHLETLDHRLDDGLDRLILTGAMTALSAGEDLLRNYLDVSVLEAGILDPMVTDVPLQPLLEDLVHECRPQAEEKGLDLRLIRCGAVVRSDPALLRRVLRNLLSNAIRYTAQGRVLVGCRRRGDALRVEVWDTGIGIPADKLGAVFEDFYQLDNPERDRTKGLGLGLSVVDRAARLLEHRVDVSSREGRGSAFAVTMPLVARGIAAPGERQAA